VLTKRLKEHQCGNLYDGLQHILANLIEHLPSTRDSARQMAQQSHHAYLFSHSYLIVNTSKARPELLPLLETCQKYGEYFRGAIRVYDSVTNAKHRFEEIRVTALGSIEPTTVTLHKDWFDALKEL